MGAVIQLAVRQEMQTCCTCGVYFSMPEELTDKRRKDHASFYCPNGHGQSYTGETEAERLKRALEFEKNRRIDAEARRDSEAARANELLSRVRKGVCPCCKRSFANVRRHMASKHPEAKD